MQKNISLMSIRIATSLQFNGKNLIELWLNFLLNNNLLIRLLFVFKQCFVFNKFFELNMKLSTEKKYLLPLWNMHDNAREPLVVGLTLVVVAAEATLSETNFPRS